MTTNLTKQRDSIGILWGYGTKFVQNWLHRKTYWYIQSNRMFFWRELCKLPPEHWYFGWQFESSKLQPVRASCSIHLVSNGKNSLRFSETFQVLFQYFENRFGSFNVDEPLHEQLPRYSRSRAKICTVCCCCFEMKGQSLLLLVRWLSKLKGTISYVLTL